MQLASTLTSSLYYEPWHVRNPDIFIIRGIFRTLEYSVVRRDLNPCQTYCEVFGKKFQAIIIFTRSSFLDHFRCLAGYYMRLCIYKCYLGCTVVLGSVSGIFRHIRALFKNIQTQIQDMLYSWHIPITKHIQTPRYILIPD